jgi:hypothetical protein
VGAATTTTTAKKTTALLETQRGSTTKRLRANHRALAVKKPPPSAGTIISCTWTGVPDQMEDFVDADATYYGRKRKCFPVDPCVFPVVDPMVEFWGSNSALFLNPFLYYFFLTPLIFFHVHFPSRHWVFATFVCRIGMHPRHLAGPTPRHLDGLDAFGVRVWQTRTVERPVAQRRGRAWSDVVERARLRRRQVCFRPSKSKKWTFGHRVLIQFFVLFSQFDSAASIRVDFFLPYASYTKHLHRCVWQGSPERTLVPGAPSASNIKGYGAAQDGGLTRSLTFKPWTQSSEDTEIRTMANDVGNGEGDSNTVSVCHN